jgi:hypothetical protein
MKIADSILFFMAIGLFLIGINQAMVLGFANSYWIFMVSLTLLFLYSYRKGRNSKTTKKPLKKNLRSSSNKKRNLI